MEDVKWMFRKCGFPILIFLFVVIVGTVCWEKLKTEKPQSVAEEVWEPPVEIENSEEVSVEEQIRNLLWSLYIGSCLNLRSA